MEQHFFITGATGLVGSGLVPRILEAFPEARMTLLVRAGGDEEAQRRVRRFSPDADRVQGLRGDVAADGLGTSAVDLAILSRSVTHIVHGAATVRFDHPIDEARSINCRGTAAMLAFAAGCRRLERFVYIGTSSVSGQRGGIIREDELEMGQAFFNTYEHSKCESERLVRDCFSDIPCTVFRPSIIVGDSRTGHTSSFNVIYIPLRLVERGMLHFIPGAPDTLLDLVPVDWVNDAMVHIMKREAAPGQVFHITAGKNRAARLGDVVEKAIAYFDRRVPLSRPRTMEFVSSEEFERRRALSRGREEALLTQLDTLLPYVGVSRLFDSRNADRVLEDRGPVFPRFLEYHEILLDYCIRSRWGKVKA